MPRWVDDLLPSVDSLYLLPGESTRVSADVVDQRGDRMAAEWVPRMEWSLSDSTLVSIEVDDAGATLTGLAPGVVTLRTRLGRGDRSLPLYVLPPGLDSIAVEPSQIVIGRGTSVGVAARLFDAAGAELGHSLHRISWVMENTEIAYLPSTPEGGGTSVQSLGQVGTTRLKLLVDGRSAFADITVTSAPSPLSNVRVQTVSDSSLQIFWEEKRQATDGYRVYRSEAENGPYVHIASPGMGRFIGYAITTWVDVGLQPATTYWYKVEACNEEACSVRSEPARGTTSG